MLSPYFDCYWTSSGDTMWQRQATLRAYLLIVKLIGRGERLTYVNAIPEERPVSCPDIVS